MEIKDKTKRKRPNHDGSPHLRPHHFKKGQSGNPNGRPKSPKRIELQEIFDEKDHDVGNLLDILYDKALNGDLPAIKEFLDRKHGKPTQTTVNTNNNREISHEQWLTKLEQEETKLTNDYPEDEDLET